MGRGCRLGRRARPGPVNTNGHVHEGPRAWKSPKRSTALSSIACQPSAAWRAFSNLQVLNAILYVAGQSCKWRGLPKRFGNWHKIYARVNCWSKSGVLDRVFEQSRQSQIVRIKLEAANSR